MVLVIFFDHTWVKRSVLIFSKVAFSPFFAGSKNWFEYKFYSLTGFLISKWQRVLWPVVLQMDDDIV